MTIVERPLPLIVKLPYMRIPPALGRLFHSNVQVAVTDSAIWLRIGSAEVAAQYLARCLPGTHYCLEGDRWLIAVGDRVASERLPELEWRELRENVELQIPLAALPGRVQLPLLPQLELRAGGQERPCHAGLFEYGVLDEWIASAPVARLSRLNVSLSKNWALVLGDPLPPIPCRFFWKEDRVLIPAGKTWYPSISVSELLEHFEVADNDLLLWVDPQEWTTISLESIKPLQRASWRQRPFTSCFCLEYRS